MEFLGQLSLSKGDRKHDHDRRQEPVRKKKVFTTFSKTRTQTPAQQAPSCPECKENHGIWRCPVFQKLSVHIERYSDLLQNAVITCLQNKSVELLVGADVQAAHRQLEYRIGPNGESNTVRTSLGWTLVGPEAELDQSKRLHINFVRLKSHLLHEQLQRMYDTDFVTRTSTEEPYSSEDRRAVKLMKDTVEKVNGHYQIDLPWKSDNLTLPNNRAVAVVTS